MLHRKKSEQKSPKIKPLAGSLMAQYKRCGRSNCRCRMGSLHGPYFYHVWYVEGERQKKYVKKADFEAVLAACSAYKQERRALRLQMSECMNYWRELRAFLRRVGL